MTKTSAARSVPVRLDALVSTSAPTTRVSSVPRRFNVSARVIISAFFPQARRDRTAAIHAHGGAAVGGRQPSLELDDVADPHVDFSLRGNAEAEHVARLQVNQLARLEPRLHVGRYRQLYATEIFSEPLLLARGRLPSRLLPALGKSGASRLNDGGRHAQIQEPAR